MSEGHLFTLAQIQILGIIHRYNMSITTILDRQPIKTLYKPRVRTNTGKQMISFKAIDLWKSIPQYLEELMSKLNQKNKYHLLTEQYLSKPSTTQFCLGSLLLKLVRITFLNKSFVFCLIVINCINLINCSFPFFSFVLLLFIYLILLLLVHRLYHFKHNWYDGR